MATVGEIAYNLKANTQDFQRGMQVADASLRKLDVTTMRVASTTGRATPGLHKLQNTLANVGFAAAGLPGPLGRVADKLSGFAFGGALTVGIAAGAAAIGLAWKKMHEAGRIAAESAQRQFEQFGALIDRIKSKLQDLAIWQLAAQREGLRHLLVAARAALAEEAGKSPLFQAPAIGPLPAINIGGPNADRLRNLRQQVESIEQAMRDLDRVTADKTWARNMAAAGEEAARGLDQVHVSLSQVLTMIQNIPLDPANFGTRIKKTLADQLAKDMEELAKTNEAMAEKIQRDFGATVDQMERDAQRAAEAINRIQFALNAMLDILDDLKAGNFGSVLGTIFGGIIGFAASGGNPAGAIAGAQIGGRVGRNFDSPNQSAAAIPPGAATISVNVSGMPPATNPLAASRDGDWIRFLSDSTKLAGARA